MSNFEQKKKRADEALLVANDFLKSNLAKEVFLKDDEVTPKKLNDKIQKELELHLDLNSKFIEVLKKESLPNEIFTQDYKVQMEIAKEKIDYLLIPDVIEHIGNPVAFLKAIKEKLTKINTKMLALQHEGQVTLKS